VNKSYKPKAEQRFKIYLRAFGVALFLWIFVVSKDRYEMLFDFPIEARNLSAQKAYREELPPYVSVKLEGSGRDLFKAFLVQKYVGFKLVLDLESISQEYEFILDQYFKKYPEKIIIPSKYKLEFLEIIHPRKIKISLDDYSSKVVPVKSNLNFEILPGHIQVGSLLIYPNEIEIAGPSEDIKKINFIETKFDTLKKVKNSVNVDLDLFSLGRLIKYSVDKVNIKIDFQEISERIISDIPVNVVNIPNDIRVFPSPQTVSLTIVGGFKRISKVISSDIKVIVDFNNWNHLQQFYEPKVIPPEDILEWRDLSPKNLEIGVARELK